MSSKKNNVFLIFLKLALSCGVHRVPSHSFATLYISRGRRWLVSCGGREGRRDKIIYCDCVLVECEGCEEEYLPEVFVQTEGIMEQYL